MLITAFNSAYEQQKQKFISLQGIQSILTTLTERERAMLSYTRLIILKLVPIS